MTQVRDCVKFEFWTDATGSPFMTLVGIKGGRQYVELHQGAADHSKLVGELVAALEAITLRMDDPATDSIAIDRTGRPQFKGSFLQLTEHARRIVAKARGVQP